MAMDKAYASSGLIFEQVSLRQNPGMLEQLKAVKPSEIVVVRGDYDHIEKLLDTLHIPYDLITPDQAKTHNGGRVMYVNCRIYGNGPAVDAAQAFVEQGGRLVATDWAQTLVARAFPGKVKKA